MANLSLEKRQITEEIKKNYGFLYVDLDIVLYPSENTHYTTIEVITKNAIEKLRFAPHPKPQKNTRHQPDLIDKMMTYNKIGWPLMLDKKIDSRTIKCPVYHCTQGFSHPALKPYLKTFNTGAIQEKKLITETLAHDPSAARRAAAAFLVGHFSNPHEILSVLSNHVEDNDEEVRNNVIRVMGSTMRTADIHKIDVLPFIRLLDSPFDTDRNKSLVVLLSAADDELSKKIIIQKSGPQLLDLLRLKQPNNHLIAYALLKKISGEDFGEKNIGAWSNWVKVSV